MVGKLVKTAFNVWMVKGAVDNTRENLKGKYFTGGMVGAGTGILSFAASFIPGIGIPLALAMDMAGGALAEHVNRQTEYGHNYHKFHYSPVVSNKRTMDSMAKAAEKFQMYRGAHLQPGASRAANMHRRYSMTFGND